MNIREDIENLYKNSLREKDSFLSGTLRLIKSAIKDKDISVRSSGVKDGIKDNEILVLLQNLIKQRRDSILSFQAANRKDLIDKEEKEIEIINKFLPKQKDEKETENIITDIIEKNNFDDIKDMGKIMAVLKAEYSGEIDMSLASKIAKLKFSN